MYMYILGNSTPELIKQNFLTDHLINVHFLSLILIFLILLKK